MEFIYVLVCLMALGFLWLASEFVSAKIRYSSYQHRNYRAMSFEWFVSAENEFGKFRNGRFGG